MAVDVDEVECADFIILACVILKKQDLLFFVFWLFSSYAFLSYRFLPTQMAHLILFIVQFAIKFWHLKYKYSLSFV